MKPSSQQRPLVRIIVTAGVSGCIQSPSGISAIRGLFAPYPAPEVSHQPSVLTLGHRKFETFSRPTTMKAAVPHLGSQWLASSFSAHPTNAPILSTSLHFAPGCRSLLFRLPTVATTQTRDNEHRTQADLHPAGLLHDGTA